MSFEGIGSKIIKFSEGIRRLMIKKRRIGIPLITLLLASFMGYGNYGLHTATDQAQTFKFSSVTDSGNLNPKPYSNLSQPKSSETQTLEKGNGTCISVYDGDTLTVRLAQSPEKPVKVRLIGIDTPELKVGEFGEAARNYLRSLSLGQDVKLVYDAERFDKYGRTLAYVYLKDGTFINASLLEKGYARVMVIPPNTAHREEFDNIQENPTEKHTGIWALPPPKLTWRGETRILP